MPKFRILPPIVLHLQLTPRPPKMSVPILIKNAKHCPKTVTGKFKSEPQITIKMPNQKFPGPRDGIRYIYLSLSPCSEVRQFLNLRRSSVKRGMIVFARTFPGTGPEDAQRRRWRQRRGAAMHQHRREK